MTQRHGGGGLGPRRGGEPRGAEGQLALPRVLGEAGRAARRGAAELPLRRGPRPPPALTAR